MARGLCSVPGCPRPAAPHDYGCKEHSAFFDAQSREEAWGLAVEILAPWVETTRKIAHPELERVMEGALQEGEREYGLAQGEREAAEAAL
jgi:hypothetical protein